MAREIEQKREHIRRLAENPAEQEKEIRQRLKLVHPGERIYIVGEPEKKQTAGAPVLARRVGRTTIERAEAVVEAAEEEPEEYGHLVEQMDRSPKRMATTLGCTPPRWPPARWAVACGLKARESAAAPLLSSNFLSKPAKRLKRRV